ncbi:MAG: hypothetical protein GKR86_01710 [Ilumatobacter sp.]|nr:hypothetical protein [Ilumatobacter sp.]NKB39771.1 hypothetical protein [Ilumatobacter sp.]
MTRPPHSVLGIATTATADEIRNAQRELARIHHPDVGGDAAVMQAVNGAAADALRMLGERVSQRPSATGGGHEQETAAGSPTDDWFGTERDVPSFTVEALPAEAFEALLVATAELGDVEGDDPPYELCALLHSPLICWCQLDVVPDAGASTINVSIAPVEGHLLPAIVDVRNAYITALNRLDWSNL